MIEIVESNPQWIAEFQRIGARLREGLGAAAIRIDHIGSTAVPGLCAKDVIDVQIGVTELDRACGLAGRGNGCLNAGARLRCCKTRSPDLHSKHPCPAEAT